MSLENFNFNNQEAVAAAKSIDISDYTEGQVLEKDGEFYLAETDTHPETKLVERNGELYVAEGEFDPGLQVMRKNEAYIPSGY